MTAQTPPHKPAFRIQQFVADYFWFVLKNLLGWLLILSAGPIGVALPGPGGIPLFLIGFGLITFPGKRQLTARVLHGRPLDLSQRPFLLFKLALSLWLPAITLWELARMDVYAIAWLIDRPWILAAAFLALIVTLWIVLTLLLRAGNLAVRGMPRARRFTRPWLRKHGIHLLPPRRRRRPDIEEGHATATVDDGEIVEIHERHYTRLRNIWLGIRKYLRFTVALVLMLMIVVMMLRPIYAKWDAVRDRIFATALSDLIFPAIVFTILFAAFLLIFRALVWRSMLKSFGHPLPLAPAMRIWSYSELARYIPGSVFQVIGRAFMLKPYGVSGSVSSTVQLLELTLFLLANIALAVLCLAWFGVKHMDGLARMWMYVSMALVPLLAVIVHPKIYYRLVNFILARIGKPPITLRLSGRKMVLLLGWTFIGLLWQSAGVYFVAAAPLELQLAKWWVVAGAYSLAWVAGFLAIFSSAGMGVREIVFGTVMMLTVPKPIRDQIGDTGTILATMYFIAFLLRLWTITGELLFAAIVTLADRSGIRASIAATVEPIEH